MAKLNWTSQLFSDLSNQQLFEILQARQTVFIVEQACPYPDIDTKDKHAWHFCAWTETTKLLAYARILEPDLSYPQASIGRILINDQVRGTGLGKELMKRAIAFTNLQFPEHDIKIGAQQRLERFYQGLGFTTTSEPYDEDGIMHIEMELVVKT